MVVAELLRLLLTPENSTGQAQELFDLILAALGACGMLCFVLHK